jgi:hypothetical protein
MTTNWSESPNSVLRGIQTLPITAFVAAFIESIKFF